MTFGQKLEGLRKERNFSQHKLARLAGVSNTTIWLIEREAVNPSFRTLKKLSRALQINVSELFAEEKS